MAFVVAIAGIMLPAISVFNTGKKRDLKRWRKRVGGEGITFDVEFGFSGDGKDS